MRCIVTDHHSSDKRRVFEGTEEDVRQDLLNKYPWLAHKLGRHASIQLLVKALNGAQAHSASLDTGDISIGDSMLKSEFDAGTGQDVVRDMMGHYHQLEAALSAAAFLAGIPVPDKATIRAALFSQDEHVEKAALVACGLDPSPAYVQALQGVLGAALQKGEVETGPEVQLSTDVVPVTKEGEEFAAGVLDAIKTKEIHQVKLGGKHSAGSMLAMTPNHVRILLKPGSGLQSPAAGARESGASQAKREAAFWAVAKSMGLGAYLPETHLLLIGGREYAAIKLLPFSFRNMNKVRETDPGLPRRLLQLYLRPGTLHKWAAMDAILGNSDRNAGNVMQRGEEIKLIDHGSALAGTEFAPATDQYSFVPYYLRALAPGDFASLSQGDRLKALPRVSAEVEKELRTWLEGLDSKAMAEHLVQYGVDPAPSMKRLEDMRSAAIHTPADLAINAAWVL